MDYSLNLSRLAYIHPDYDGGPRLGVVEMKALGPSLQHRQSHIGSADLQRWEAVGIVRGIGHVHANACVHRDIVPSFAEVNACGFAADMDTVKKKKKVVISYESYEFKDVRSALRFVIAEKRKKYAEDFERAFPSAKCPTLATKNALKSGRLRGRGIKTGPRATHAKKKPEADVNVKLPNGVTFNKSKETYVCSVSHKGERIQRNVPTSQENALEKAIELVEHMRANIAQYYEGKVKKNRWTKKISQ